MAKKKLTADARPQKTWAAFHSDGMLWALALIGLTLGVYIPAMRGGFVWDDILITGNRMIRESDGLRRFWFTTEALDYYPLTWSVWWLEWRLWGSSSTGYHVINVLFHIANVILVWMTLRRLQIPGAWLAGLVFAIHPVNVATAAWISEQKNTLSMFFCAATILLYLKFDQQGRWRWYILSLAMFLLALFAKTAVVMLPFVLLACVWWLHGKIRVRDIARTLPFFILSLTLGLVTIWFQFHRAMQGYTTRTEGFLARLAGAGWVPWFYLFKALFPSNLSAIYPKWTINASSSISYLPGLVMAGCFGFFWRKRKTWGRSLLFAFGYFIVMLFPVLGFFDQGFYECSLVADHWQYFAIAGIIGLVAAMGVTVFERIGKLGQSLAVLTTAAGLIVLAVSAYARSSVYANSLALWQDTVSKNPDAWLAHNNLGIELFKSGELQNAIRQFQQALRLKPNYANAHKNLGVVLSQVGRVNDAIEHYEQALRIEPELADVHNNLGTALLQVGRVEDSISHYEDALRIEPDYAEAHYNLGAALARSGHTERAVWHYQQALRIRPDYLEARLNLGTSLAANGKVQDAIHQFVEAARIRPDSVEAHNNLGAALFELGRVPEAISQFEQALQIKPDDANARYNLARARMGQQNTQQQRKN
jgi:tetratricopeptide (TPR) repeat protein